MFLSKGIMKICSKCTGERPCRSVLSIELLEITLQRGCSPVNLLHIFRAPFLMNTSERLLLDGPIPSQFEKVSLLKKPVSGGLTALQAK